MNIWSNWWSIVLFCFLLDTDGTEKVLVVGDYRDETASSTPELFDGNSWIEKTNDIISKALNILTCLEHRGAVSSDGRTGDGAGILIEIPDNFSKPLTKKYQT